MCDANRKGKRQLYTALSRTRKFEFIQLNFKELPEYNQCWN